MSGSSGSDSDDYSMDELKSLEVDGAQSLTKNGQHVVQVSMALFFHCPTSSTLKRLTLSKTTFSSKSSALTICYMPTFSFKIVKI